MSYISKDFNLFVGFKLYNDSILLYEPKNKDLFYKPSNLLSKTYTLQNNERIVGIRSTRMDYREEAFLFDF